MRMNGKNARLIALTGLTTLIALTAVWTRGAMTGSGRETMPAAQAEETQSHEALSYPTDGEILRGYSGMTPVWSATLSAFEMHEGVDFAGEGTVFACAAGRVTSVENAGRYGLTVSVTHEDGTRAEYASLRDAGVKVGQRVCAGQEIGHAGNSAVCERELGSHLHFCYYENGEIVCPPFTIER